MKNKPGIKEISETFKKALHTAKRSHKHAGLINAEDTSIIFYDYSFLKCRLEQIRNSFPADILNTVAIKANPLVKNLKFFKEEKFGLEAASLAELYLAEKSGVHPSKIVFDSPAKTEKELEYALKLGVRINADSFAELERIDNLLKKIKSKSEIGIRINPQVGSGRIKITSTADEYSKFGVPIKNFKDELKNSFAEFSWLTGVHLHIGSQGISLKMLLDGIGAVYEFTEMTNDFLQIKNLPNRIKSFDIGGGLPVRYKKDDVEISVSEYAKEIKKNFPALFSKKYKLLTEFGRWINANAGWTASRVEYVKKQGGINTAVIHVGADMFLRRVYNPGEWHHDISVLDCNGEIKKGKKKRYVIAGPLCFSGDIISTNILLPETEAGDFVIIHDTGAYTLSMWSRYNSRQMPKVIAYLENGKEFTVIKKREKLSELYSFWS